MALPEEIVLIRSTYSASGGVERVALSLIKGLLKKGVRLTLLTLPGQKWPLAHPDFKIVPLGIQRGHRLLIAWSFNRAVNRYLDGHGSECVLSLDRVTNFTHLHAGGGTHKSFLAIKSRYSGPVDRFFQKCSIFHRYLLYLEKKGFGNERLQKIRCNSALVLDDVTKDYNVPREKLVVIHSGIRWQEMEDSFRHRVDIGQSLCRDHHLSPEWECLLFLGSGFARKGLDLAIQGLAGMPEKYHLIVVGKGTTRLYRRLAVRLRLDRRVHFLGPQPNGWRYACCCKALVLPSRYDPFGGSAAEGHAMGIPVLVSDKTGYADWVVHGQNGIILKSPMNTDDVQRSFNALTQLIEQPLCTPDQLRRHARNVDDDVILEQLLDNFLNV
jgi:UDP-glucose:(heptosyl)LPS alpha-1,3-glucosyltransferase